MYVNHITNSHDITFLGARGPFTDWDGKPTPTVEVRREDFPLIRDQYGIDEGEYDEMVTVIGAWILNKETKVKSFVFVSEHGKTKKLIVISEYFLRELLKKYRVPLYLRLIRGLRRILNNL